ncbi:hypothetical protein QR680_010752 [Steinernema hermaphroditum]|uniref:NADP-dependent oxidoreductase domain-containing protein n=1 Tax=Steinernema hermaphroditum TaxID=289476 RepID=A0AA39IQ04_9BILA|nr:hypothetical protein QR680_010752 [Steinernema hermaphroditum]
MTVPTTTLPTGAKLPLLGLGTWLSKPDEVKNAVREALDAGYRYIDTAFIYKNESEIGDVLQEYICSGKIKREELFITTKLFCSHNRPEEVEAEMRDSLGRLKLDYVDLYLIHGPVPFEHDMSAQLPDVRVEDTWRGMEGVFEKGLAKAIGVSNFSIEQVERIQKVAKVPIHNIQVECHIYFPQFDLHDVCKKHNISFTAYAPLGSPGRLQQTAGKWELSPSPLEDDTVKSIAEKHGKTPAQVLIRHLIQRGLSVIPKSVNEKRIKENFDVLDFELNEEEISKLNSAKHCQRLFVGDLFKGHYEDPYKLERKQ